MTKRCSTPISAEARALPAAAYTSAEFFAAELAHVHRRSWFFVGRADELASPGDYRAIDTVAGPVLLLRDLAGELRAFANCCRHRGSRLLAGSGNRRTIVCPYHGWGYRLDGSLAGAPDMGGVAGFRPSEQGLIPIRLALWQGFIFLTLDADAPALAEVLGNMPDVFGSHHLDEMVCTWRAELDARCNWKLLVENAMESYHTGYIHALTVGAQTSIDIETTGDWACLQVLDDRSIAVLGDAPPPFPPIEGLAVAQDSMWWLQVRPLAADRSILSLGGCFPNGVTARADFEEKARPYYDRWLRVAEEDVGMLEIQQVGLGSALYRPGPLSWREALVERIDRWIVDRLPASSGSDLTNYGKITILRAGR
jgi:phenylpropionate dioxygenase-like ring-hydroxylating dioxygenase large terminal subunit